MTWSQSSSACAGKVAKEGGYFPGRECEGIHTTINWEPGQQTTGHATKVRWLRDGEMEEERCREMGAIAAFSVGVKTGSKISEATDNRQ